MNGRDYLINLAVKYAGDYNLIMKAIEEREDVSTFKLPKLNSKVLTLLDEEYPQELRSFYRAPLVLFYHGNISLLKDTTKNLAVIGTRNCGEYGVKKTIEIVEVIDKEFNIVSGLAIGIDAIAHAQALRDKKNTIAVLGSGINYCYPLENKDLYDAIKEKGLIISEYPEDTVPTPDKFPFRNRIIAMISRGVIITEAYQRSGTSITANFALSLNKDIMCVPYPAGTDSLCNSLIKIGADLIETGDDVLNLEHYVKEKPIFEI